MTITLKDNEVIVWWVDVDAVGEAQWPVLEAVLSEAERVRAKRFHFRHDWESYVAAHALGRLLLSRYAGGEPSAWQFTVGDHGKPEVISASAPLRLNLSHTRGMAAAVLALRGDVGIDVEWLDRRTATLGLAERFFAAAECARVAAVPPEQTQETFLAFWTLKEAYVKAIGKGLAQPLDSFSFDLDNLSISFAEGVAGEPDEWLFHRMTPDPRHTMAVAFNHRSPSNVRLVEFEFLPSVLPDHS